MAHLPLQALELPALALLGHEGLIDHTGQHDLVGGQCTTHFTAHGFEAVTLLINVYDTGSREAIAAAAKSDPVIANTVNIVGSVVRHLEYKRVLQESADYRVDKSSSR